MNPRYDDDNASIRTVVAPPPAYSRVVPRNQTVVPQNQYYGWEPSYSQRPPSPAPTYRTIDDRATNPPVSGDVEDKGRLYDSEDEDEDTEREWEPSSSQTEGTFQKFKAPTDEELDPNAWAAMQTNPKLRNTRVIERLIELGRIDVKSRDNSGQTALHKACEWNLPIAVRLLMRKGADNRAQDVNGFTPFMLAAQNGHVAVMRQINVRERRIERLVPVSGKLEPLYEEVLIPLLCGKERVKETGKEREKGKGKNKAKGKEKEKPKWLEEDQKEEKGQWKDKGKGKGTRLNEVIGGTTVLHSAAKAGHKEVVDLLLHSGALRNISDKNRRIPADLARLNRKWDVMFTLDREHLVQAEYLLSLAARKGEKNEIKRILDRTPQPMKKRVGSRAILAAVMADREDFVKWLVDLGHDINGEVRTFGSPIVVAVLDGCKKRVEMLLSHGASPHCKTPAGFTPLMQAAECGYEDLVLLLLKRGADVSDTDRTGQTALHVAARTGRRAAYAGREKVITTLLGAGIDLHARDDQGWTALDAAIEHGDKDVVRIISDFIGNREKSQWMN